MLIYLLSNIRWTRSSVFCSGMKYKQVVSESACRFLLQDKTIRDTYKRGHDNEIGLFNLLLNLLYFYTLALLTRHVSLGRLLGMQRSLVWYYCQYDNWFRPIFGTTYAMMMQDVAHFQIFGFSIESKFLYFSFVLTLSS